MIRSTAERKKRSTATKERRWLKVLGTLNELQARLFVADKALDLGRGGISRLAALTGMSRTTITKAVEELEGSRKLISPPEGRVRHTGGGRKKIAEVDPAIRALLTEILEETTAGDPMSLLRWTSKSTRVIAEELTRRGHPISWMTVARYLDQMGYTLQANRKTREGPQHPDRDAQFRYIHRRVRDFLRTADPVISVDTKKKELIGAFKNGGRTWRRRGKPEEVNARDFPHLGQRHSTRPRPHGRRHPVLIYYFDVTRGPALMQAAGRATTRRTGQKFPARPFYINQTWQVTLELPALAHGIPLAVAVWNGSQQDRDGRKYFSLWHQTRSLQ